MGVHKVGSRVFAVASADEKTVRLFGFGVYVGDEVPPPEVDGMRLARGLALPNPKIQLDGGDVVWGCECWWGPEEKFESRMRLGREVVHVSIHEARAAARSEALP